MITVTKFTTATAADVLASTDLANIPDEGQLDLFFASTANDSLVSIFGPENEPVIRGMAMEQRTNGQPDLQSGLQYSVPVTKGGHYTISVTIQTAGTIGVIAVFRRPWEIE